jgi:hypothetical protein
MGRVVGHPRVTHQTRLFIYFLRKKEKKSEAMN